MKNSDIGKIQSYLYSIFGNLLKNYYKKKKDLLTKQMPEISENRLIEIEIRLDIEQAVDRLPEEIKETAIFFFFQEIKQKEIVDLLFRPSFSTSEKITDISGRGVGLDVVKTKIEGLGGNIECKRAI